MFFNLLGSRGKNHKSRNFFEQNKKVGSSLDNSFSTFLLDVQSRTVSKRPHLPPTSLPYRYTLSCPHPPKQKCFYYQSLHLGTGFIFEFAGQAKSLAKSSFCDKGPFTLNWSGECSSVDRLIFMLCLRSLSHQFCP